MKYLQFLILISIFTACHNTPGKNDGEKTTADTSNANTLFFPVADYIKSQVRLVDSLQLPIVKTIINGKDSVFSSMTPEEYKNMAAQFWTPSINDDKLKNQYHETSFADQSLGSATFTYTTNNPELEIQRIDVIIDPDPVQADKVRSIYIEKIYKKNDTAFLKKLYWRVNKNFQVITNARIKNATPIITIEKVSWSGE